MEQNSQQNSQKTPFPIRTRIIGILMLLISGVGLVISIFGFYTSATWEGCSYLGSAFLFGSVVSIIFSIIFFIPGLLILRKKRLGWWLAIIIFSIVTALVIIWTIYEIELIILVLLIVITLLILLLRDRKNFFKIAS